MVHVYLIPSVKLSKGGLIEKCPTCWAWPYSSYPYSLLACVQTSCNQAPLFLIQHDSRKIDSASTTQKPPLSFGEFNKYPFFGLLLCGWDLSKSPLKLVFWLSIQGKSLMSPPLGKFNCEGIYSLQ